MSLETRLAVLEDRIRVERPGRLNLVRYEGDAPPSEEKPEEAMTAIGPGETHIWEWDGSAFSRLGSHAW